MSKLTKAKEATLSFRLFMHPKIWALLQEEARTTGVSLSELVRKKAQRGKNRHNTAPAEYTAPNNAGHRGIPGKCVGPPGNIRLTVSDLHRLKKMAHRRGLSCGKFVRDCVTAQLEHEVGEI